MMREISAPVLAVVAFAMGMMLGVAFNFTADGGSKMPPMGPQRRMNLDNFNEPSSIGNERLIIINTMTYEHIYRRPNLARTAAQLQQAGPRLLWVIQEDTHSLRKLVSSQEHYDWIVADTERFISTLGVTFKYLHADSPFEFKAPRSPVIETYQRNQALNYSYDVVEDTQLAQKYNCTCTLSGERGSQVRQLWRQNKPLTPAATIDELYKCPVIFIADDDNAYMPTLYPTLRKVMNVALFPTGNMGYDGIEGPIIRQTPADDPRGLQGRVTGFNSWHGSTLENPRGWDKNGNDRRFKVDMAGIAFNAVLTPRFTGPRYGYHETDIVEQTGVVELDQIEGTMDVLAHHIHNGPANGRLCYPLDWDYVSTTNVWFNTKAKKTFSNRTAACGGCAPQPGALDFRGCSAGK